MAARSAGLEHEEAGAGGARAARGDERDDRHRRAQLGLRDLAHRRRAGRPACRARARRPRRARPAGGVDLVDDPVGRDGVDVGIEHDHSHVRRLGRGARRQRETGDECHGQEAQCAHRRSQPTPGRWRGRDAEAAREAGVVRRALIRSPARRGRAAGCSRPRPRPRRTRYGELTVDGAGHAGRARPAALQRAPFAFDLLGARWRARAGAERRGARAREPRGRGRAGRRLEPDAGGAVSHAEPVWLPGSDVAAAARARGRGRVPHRARGGRSQPAAAVCGRSRRRPISPTIISRAGWGADESLKRAAPRYARRHAHGVRPPHRHAERLRARGRAGDHPLDLHLPRALERLERHRLQLPRRRLRAGLRGARRRHRPARDRRANAGLQHRQRRHRRDRRTARSRRSRAADARRAHEADRVAARCRARRSARPRDDDLGGNDRFAAGKSATLPRRQRPSRRALDRLPGRARSIPSSTRSPLLRRPPGRPRSSMPARRRRSSGRTTSGALAPIAFRARVLGGASWSLTVLDARGAPVASNSGSGERRRLDLERRALRRHAVAPGTKLAYRIEARNAAGASARPAARLARRRARAVATAPPLALAPAVISPDGDGADDTLDDRLHARGARGRHARGRRAATRRRSQTLVAGVQLPAGGQSARWGGEGLAGIVADGIYTVRLHLVDGAGQVAERSGSGGRDPRRAQAAAEPQRGRAQRRRDGLVAADAAVGAVGRARVERARARPRR